METHGRILSTVAADALVIKDQTLSIRSAGHIAFSLGIFREHTMIIFLNCVLLVLHSIK